MSVDQFPKLSERGQATASVEGFLGKYLTVALNNPYNETHNPEGVINLGNAANTLMGPELQEKLRQEESFKFTSSDHMAYFNLTGTHRAKETISNFLKQWFSGGIDVPQDELFVLNGATACLDALSYALLDEGDVLITPTPVYGRVFTNFIQRFRCDVEPLDLLPSASGGEDFKLVVEDLESKIVELRTKGKKVKAFILLNPQNPLGVVYPIEVVLQIINVCAKYEMHFISDEVYGLSVFGQGAKFQSVLSLENLPDPERVHVIYGMSKDFGLAGLRFGVIHSRTKGIQRLLTEWSSFHCVASVVQDTVANMLNDTDWCRKFMTTKNKRLEENFNLVNESLGAIGVKVLDSSAGLFAWANFSEFLSEPTKQDEIDLFETILQAGVYIVPGFIMKSQVFGWFRIVFSSDQRILRVGLKRITETLQNIRKRKKEIASP